MLGTILLYAVLFWSFLVLTWFVAQYKYFVYLRKLPGPKPLPIIGNTILVLSISLKDVIPTLTRFTKQYGKIFKATVMYGIIGILTTDYKFIEHILGSPVILKKSLTYRLVEKWLGMGLLTSHGSKWKKHRKIITPAFHFKILEQFVTTFEKNSTILVGLLKNELLSNSFDVYPYSNLMALDVICETALGTEINAQKNAESEYVRSVKEMCKIIITRSLNPLYLFNFIYKFTNLSKREKHALSILHGTTESVIQKKRKETEINKEVVDEDLGVKKRLAFLDLLLQSTVDGRPLTDKELREEVDTFMFAGHDTISSSLSFTLYNLALYPEVQNRVVDELKDIFDDDFYRPSTYADLQEMKYLEAVIKETLRLFPPVPLIGRQNETEFDYEGTKIPPGTYILIFIHGVMRDPNLFSEPEKFDPDRFLVESNGHLPFSYIPFSAGPRNCIGQKFAMLEMKSTIARVLRSYELLPAEPHHELMLQPEIIMKSTNGVRIRIKERRI